MTTGKDVDLDLALESASDNCESEPMNAEDPLFLLYTSGSTGKPKGLVHSQAGYLLYAAVTTSAVFDCQPGDRFGCVADIGWITGHTYTVYGPLVNGAASLLFESVPSYPDPGRYWATVEKYKLTQVNNTSIEKSQIFAIPYICKRHDFGRSKLFYNFVVFNKLYNTEFYKINCL